MGYGITNNDVEVRLLGKVKFTDDDDDENRFPRKLLTRLVREAVGKVERDLEPRYETPFVHADAGTFDALPSTTKETIRTMFELMAVVRVLGNDFGRGTVSNGGEFKAEQERLYRDMLERELSQRQDGAVGQWRYPPMRELRTSIQNSMDDGFHGTIVVTTRDDTGDLTSKQVTDPSQNFFNGTIDE